MGAKEAIDKYCQKQLKQKRTTKNKSPEQDLVKEISKWLKDNDFIFNIVESKAVYSKGACRYLRGQTDSGFSDITGVDKNGIPVFIEAKAPGKLKTIRLAQHDFLRARINRNCFAVCVDSVKLLEKTYKCFYHLKTQDEKKVFLLNMLPEPRKLGAQDLDFEEK